MLNHAQNSPTRTLQILNKKTLELCANSQNEKKLPLKRLGSLKKINTVEAEPIDATILEQTFSTLETQIQQTKQQGNLVPQISKEQEYSIVDILPVIVQDEEANQEQKTDGDGEKVNIFDANIPMDEKIKILRAQPELLHEFVLDAERSRREQEIEQKQIELEKRIMHRQEMNTQKLPFIVDYVEYNQNVQIDTQKALRAQLLEVEIEDVLSRQKRNLELEEYYSEQKIKKAVPVKILPEIFIYQKNKLAVFLHFTSRIAILQSKSQQYVEIVSSNMKILHARKIILEHLRDRESFIRQRDELSAVTLITSCLRIRRNCRNKNFRKQSLERIKQFLSIVYEQQTFLGSVNKFSELKNQLKEDFNLFHIKLAARSEILKCIIIPFEKEDSYLLWKKEKEAWIAKQMRILSDPRKMRDYKAFIAKYVPGAEVVPDAEDLERLKQIELTEEQIDYLAKSFAQRIAQEYEDELEECFITNSEQVTMQIQVFCGLPARNILKEAFSVVRRGENVARWLLSEEIELRNNEE